MSGEVSSLATEGLDTDAGSATARVTGHSTNCIEYARVGAMTVIVYRKVPFPDRNELRGR